MNPTVIGLHWNWVVWVWDKLPQNSPWRPCTIPTSISSFSIDNEFEGSQGELKSGYSPKALRRFKICCRELAALRDFMLGLDSFVVRTVGGCWLLTVSSSLLASFREEGLLPRLLLMVATEVSLATVAAAAVGVPSAPACRAPLFKSLSLCIPLSLVANSCKFTLSKCCLSPPARIPGCLLSCPAVEDQQFSMLATSFNMVKNNHLVRRTSKVVSYLWFHPQQGEDPSCKVWDCGMVVLQVQDLWSRQQILEVPGVPSQVLQLASERHCGCHLTVSLLFLWVPEGFQLLSFPWRTQTKAWASLLHL